MDKDVRAVLKAVKAQGFEVTYTKKGHARVWHEGQWVATFSGSSSDRRAMKNGIAELRRVGFRWPPRK